MIEFSLGNIKNEMKHPLIFPDDLCCNCGSKGSLKTVEQDTRLTKFFGGAGTESTFKFTLPFCERCEASSMRRPKTLFHRLMLFALTFAITATALVIVAGFILDLKSIADNTVYISLGVSLLIVGAQILRQRPGHGQSSYFQPVRIVKLKRKFVSGALTAIKLHLSNQEYKAVFGNYNYEAITDKEIELQ